MVTKMDVSPNLGKQTQTSLQIINIDKPVLDMRRRLFTQKDVFFTVNQWVLGLSIGYYCMTITAFWSLFSFVRMCFIGKLLKCMFLVQYYEGLKHHKLFGDLTVLHLFLSDIFPSCFLMNKVKKKLFSIFVVVNRNNKEKQMREKCRRRREEPILCDKLG